MTTAGIGIVGAGVVSETYLRNLSAFPDLRVVAVGDRNPERARDRAEAHGVPVWGDVDAVLSHPDVRIVVNLTTPAAHVAISTAAIRAGKHVWTEKPIGIDRASVDELLALAEAAGLRIGSAPDTVLGPGIQSARRAIETGLIGTPLFARTAFQTRGPDVWHPAPQFLFARGAGPLLDIGPYYLTALVNVLGPVTRVGAMGLTARTEREIRTGPDAGTRFPVEVPTTVHVLTAFESGLQAQSVLTFDSALERHGVIEIHGTEGSLSLPDPNRFEGRTAFVRPVEDRRDGEEVHQPWIEVPQDGVVVGRGLGILEMARAIAEGRPHRASGALGRHVLDVMLSVEESVADGRFVAVESSVEPIPAMPVDFDPFARTL
ncbi:Gfo/Idh/MocA family protein [Microbacterium tumbae]